MILIVHRRLEIPRAMRCLTKVRMSPEVRRSHVHENMQTYISDSWKSNFKRRSA